MPLRVRELRQVHVSKAGKNAMLPAQTALLAAGNPTGGHFDPTREIAEQVDLKSPLLSRFDVIFTMRSQEDEETVSEIGRRMVRTRQVAGKLARGEDVADEVLEDVSADVTAEEFGANITRAKQVQPVVRDQTVARRMYDWFTDLKTSLPERYGDGLEDGEDYDGPPLPITARKLGAVQRLAEASARVRLSDEIEAEDVDRVVPLIERSLADIGIAPRDNSAFGVVDGKTPTSVGLGD
ncbi:MAG: hypothetical protein ACQETI_03115 [Halobacteriota archaeon]